MVLRLCNGFDQIRISRRRIERKEERNGRVLGSLWEYKRSDILGMRDIT
jgi:hypothetical protein